MPTKPSSSRVRLTKAAIEDVAAPDQGQRFLRDAVLPGFAVRITAAGTKTFVLEKRIEGRNRRLRIGRVGEMTLPQARTRAQQLLGQIALGVDPVRQRKESRIRSLTLSQVFGDYFDARPTLAAQTKQDYERALNKVFRDWRDKPLVSINRAMVKARHLELAESRGKHAANKYLRILRAVISFAMDNYEEFDGEPVFKHNPVLVLSRTRAWYPSRRRQSVVKSHELPRWHSAVEGLRESDHPDSIGDTVADFLHLLLFTGLRRSEAASLRWQDVDFEGNTFSIPENKSNRPHSLPVTPFIRDLLVKRLGATQGPFVFAGKYPDQPMVEPKRQIKHVVEESGVQFSSHDLRRTFITIAEAISLSPYTIKKLANHSTGGDVTAGYIIWDIERLREPMLMIEKYLLSAIGGQSEAKLSYLHASRPLVL